MTPKLNAYLEQIRSGKLNTKKLKVIKALQESPRTIEYFRNVEKMAHQSITAVLSILCDEGVVTMRAGASEKYSLFTLVHSEEMQLKLARERFLHKKELFITQGIKNGYIAYDENNRLIIL